MPQCNGDHVQDNNQDQKHQLVNNHGTGKDSIFFQNQNPGHISDLEYWARKQICIMHKRNENSFYDFPQTIHYAMVIPYILIFGQGGKSFIITLAFLCFTLSMAMFFLSMLSRPRQSYIHHRIHLTSGVPYLGWNVGPGNCSDGYILEKNHEKP